MLLGRTGRRLWTVACLAVVLTVVTKLLSRMGVLPLTPIIWNGVIGDRSLYVFVGIALGVVLTSWVIVVDRLLIRAKLCRTCLRPNIWTGRLLRTVWAKS